jgi:hypothetical protein
MTNKNKGLIIGVGFQKTGTSTLRDALKILGYRVKDTTGRATLPILRGDWKKIKKILDGYDAVEDTPWYYIYKELDKLYPNSKFILTYREPESWYKSVSRHIGELRSPKHEWLYGRGKGLPKDDKNNTLKIYNNHIKEVRNYFKKRSNDFLEVDFIKGDKWERICEFLGKDVPREDFPHANNSANNKGKLNSQMGKFKFFRKQFRYTAQIKYIDILGLWEK